MVIPHHGIRRGERRGARRGARAVGTVDPRAVAVVALDDPVARSVEVAGAKAANLAVARAAGLPAPPGFLVPSATVAAAAAGGGFVAGAERAGLLHEAWSVLSGDGRDALVVRSSSVSEDGGTSSMAGRFRSIIDVRGWDAFLAALDDVAASASVIALDGSGRTETHPMAILVQPFVVSRHGGVLFGADPVSGRRDRLVLAAVSGGPDRLVAGELQGSHEVLTPRGRVVERAGDGQAAVGRRTRHALAALARHAARVFGAPQDIEWGVDARGRLWLFQSRPLTALPPRPVAGPVFGPAPVAETFPDPLTVLEQDLWLVPLREGMAHALALAGAASPRALARSPLVVSVGGRLAVDLELTGVAPPPRHAVARLDPRPPARRLRAAWRTGRLQRTLPELARQLVETVDAELGAVGPLPDAGDGELGRLLHAGRRALVALHGQEVLAGLLVRDAAATGSGAGAALATLASARAEAMPEARIVPQHPEVLALVPPAIRPVTPPPPLPVLALDPDPVRPAACDEMATLREELRMRARLVQELTALAAWEIGLRLHARGLLADPDEVRDVALADIDAALRGGAPTLHDRAGGPPLPAAFRLDDGGRPIAEAAGHAGGARGAGGGRRAGTVVHDVDRAKPGVGAVLVVDVLAPSLAASLPGLAALVAETGSPLSHLAILARELAIPTVVGLEGARRRYPEGTVVVVDGAAGSVEVVSEGSR